MSDESHIDDWLETNVEIVTDAADIAEVTRSHRMSRDSESLAILQHILEETEAAYVLLNSEWSGNEFLGGWYRDWIVHIDWASESAIHITRGINASYPIGSLRKSPVDTSSPSSISQTQKTRHIDRALNWEQRTGRHDYHYLSDEYCPKSQIDTVIQTPERQDHYVFENKEVHRGALSNGDLLIRETQMDRSSYQYQSEKFVVEGETYTAFKECLLKDALPFEDVTTDDGTIIEHGCYHTYNGEAQLLDMSGLETFIKYANEAGFSVAVKSEFSEYVPSEL